nr:zf-HC2 domain-containing protein [uncultured Schaedlerella sp.]
MKQISCNVIKDILPLYLDDVVSQDTREMVEEHLESCDACRKEACVLKSSIALPADRSTKFLDARILKNLKKRLFKRKAVTAILSAAAAAAVIFGVYCILTLPKIFIPYDSARISIEETDGKLYASYEGDNLDMTFGTHPFDMEIDGEEKRRLSSAIMKPFGRNISRLYFQAVITYMMTDIRSTWETGKKSTESTTDQVIFLTNFILIRWIIMEMGFSIRMR